MFYLFGDPDHVVWCSLWFLFNNMLIAGLAFEARNWVKRWVFFVDIVLGLQIWEGVFNIFTLFFHKLGDVLNRCSLLALSIISVMLIYSLKYDRGAKKGF